MKRYAALIGAIVLIAVGVLLIVNERVAKAPTDGRACTQEAKLCSDGSAVGRTGPNCEFAECPMAVATIRTTHNGGGGAILPNGSGVRGAVLLGPTCPVMRDPPDPQCADTPYATAIMVYRAGSRSPFIIGNSSANGAFELSLPPGSYTLTAGVGKFFPLCNETNVIVVPNVYATVDISCDTGIR